jgi:hypothetical protein
MRLTGRGWGGTVARTCAVRASLRGVLCTRLRATMRRGLEPDMEMWLPPSTTDTPGNIRGCEPALTRLAGGLGTGSGAGCFLPPEECHGNRWA